MRSPGRATGVLGLAILSLSWFVSSASAEERSPGLQLSAGVFNMSKSETELEAGVELRLPTPFWKLDVTGGLTTTEEGATWLYFGMRRDFRLGKRWVVAPGFAFSHYAVFDGKDLGGPLEFRSAVDLAYRLTPKKRLGLTLYHLSNAGYYDRNPGSNSLIVTYSFDFK
jgi:hypothetical protein